MSTLRFFTALLWCVFCCIFPGTSWASDAVRIYLELSSPASTVLPYPQGQDYLRCRAVFLDADNELATTFDGAPIADSELILSSSFGDKVRFSTEPATTSASQLSSNTGLWKTAANSVSVDLEQAWQEFAVSYDEQTGDDTITVTLKHGGATITASARVTVSAPLANCYVVRTGGLLALEVLDEIPARKNDGGSVKIKGSSTVVDVFAAFYNSAGDTYIYTDNVPEEAEDATITGGGDSATVSLADDGHVQVSLTVSSVSVSTSDIKAANDDYLNGNEITFSAKPSSTSTSREIGTRGGDVTDDEFINVSKDTYFGNQTGDSDYKSDTSTYKALNILDKIIIVGLPVNEVTENGVHQESGFGGQNKKAGTAAIDPRDALTLLEDPSDKPSQFRVPGEKNSTFIYGAIIGLDADDSPAPFAQNLTATFYLKKTGGVAVNSSAAELRAVTTTSAGGGPYYSGSPVSTRITATYGYQYFLPFQITATAATADGTYASITDLYIDKVELYTSSGTLDSELSSSYYSTLDEVSEGVDFIAQDTVASVTLTDIDSLDGKNAGDDAEIKLEGRGAEKKFTLRVLDDGGSSIEIGPKDSAAASETLTIPNTEGNLAERDVAFFSEAADKHLYFLFSGDSRDTRFLQYYPPDGSDGLTLSAADTSDFAPDSISTELDQINVVIDQEYAHDTIALEDVVSVKDIFSNSYGATGATLEASDIEGSIYLPAEDGTASDQLFPGTSVKVDDNVIEAQFSLDDISVEQQSGILKLTGASGQPSAELAINISEVSQIALKNIFVPVAGISESPVMLYLEDQHGDMVAPVTVTSANAPSDDATASKGNAIAVEVESDNGSLKYASASETIIRTTEPWKIFSVGPASGKSSLSITAETDDYGTDLLTLSFTPDFEKPIVGDVTAGLCSVDIEVLDNRAVDTSAADITVLDSEGEDITATLTRTDTDNGTTGTISLSGFPEGAEGVPASYTITITVRDASRNEREVTRTFSLECYDLPIACLSVDPTFAVAGDTLDVTITGENTSFINELTEVAFSCDNATVNDVTVQSSTEVVVNVTIAGVPPVEPTSTLAIFIPSRAEEGSGTDDGDGQGDDDGSSDTESELCDITVTTGSEEVVCEDSFEIFSDTPSDNTTDPEDREPECLQLSITSIPGEMTENIVITAKDTSFSDGTSVAFSCGEITVNSFAVDSDEQITVNITSAAVEETVTCDVTVDDGSDTLDCGTLLITPPPPVTCELAGLSISSVRPRMMPYLVTITGSAACSFGRRPDIDFGTETIRSITLLRTRKRIVCLVFVSRATVSGDYEVTVDGYDGISLTVE